jgi:hypothetical protein
VLPSTIDTHGEAEERAADALNIFDRHDAVTGGVRIPQAGLIEICGGPDLGRYASL